MMLVIKFGAYNQSVTGIQQPHNPTGLSKIWRENSKDKSRMRRYYKTSMSYLINWKLTQLSSNLPTEEPPPLKAQLNHIKIS